MRILAHPIKCDWVGIKKAGIEKMKSENYLITPWFYVRHIAP